MCPIPPTEPVDDAQWDGPPPSYLIESHVRLIGFFQTCPNAQTLEAYSKRFRTTVYLPLPCKKWSCRHCGPKKVQRLAYRCEDAKPNRLLTLTVDTKLWDTPRAAFDGTRRKVPDLVKLLRARYGEFEYVRVTEITRRGWPHYHLLVRSPYLPHAVVKKFWQDLTGATIVDLRQVDDRFRAVTYLIKYLSKLHKIEWTERHVSYSRGFFPPEEPRPASPLELEETAVIECHPATLLYNQFRGATIVALAWNVFALNPPADIVDRVTGRGPWVEGSIRLITPNPSP